MTPEDRSKLQSFLTDIDKLRSRDPEEKKVKDWKSDVEKKLEDAFGKTSEQLARFRRVKFFDFSRGGRPPAQPLTETERRDFFASLDDAKRVLRQII
jgi:hypothetical protein